jgi:hypothetical protein
MDLDIMLALLALGRDPLVVSISNRHSVGPITQARIWQGSAASSTAWSRHALY